MGVRGVGATEGKRDAEAGGERGADNYSAVSFRSLRFGMRDRDGRPKPCPFWPPLTPICSGYGLPSGRPRADECQPGSNWPGSG